MDSGKFVVRVEPALHSRLKEYAHSRQWSLNQTCIALLELALQGEEKPPVAEIDWAPLIEPLRECFEHQGMLAILKINDYFADFLVIFDQNPHSANDFNKSYRDVIRETRWGDTQIQAFSQMPDHTPAPPSTLWIHISRSAEILWARDEQVGTTLVEIFSRWRKFASW